MGTRGAIAAGDAQTAEAGAEALHAGGNAVDAICAAAFAAFVAELPLCSPAGAGVLLWGRPDAGFSLLDFFVTTPGLGPAGGSPTALDFHGVTVDFGPTTQTFHVGRGAAAVPTALLGLLEAHREGGSLPLAEIVGPAIRLARDGYELSKPVGFVFSLLEPIVTLTPSVGELFCQDEVLARPGARLRNPKLGDFLAELAEEGERLVRGPLADALVAEFGPGAGGLITHEDLERYQPVRREPLRMSFGPYEVLTNPPPSSGGTLIALGLELMERLKLEQTEFLGADHLSTVAAVLATLSDVRKAGYDERITEADLVDDLFSDASLRQWGNRVSAIKEETALGSTTHISVLDGDGGAAALTISNGEGCGHALEAYGIHVNNFLGEDDINPLGFHSLEPGTRMTTGMAPTIVLADGRPRLVLGSGGSNRIRSAILQGLINALVFRRPLEECVNAARLHVEGRRLWFEDFGLDEGVAEALQQGWPDHTRFTAPNMFFGGVHAALLDDGALAGGGDHRRGGTFVVVG